ncbi:MULTISPECIES: permease [unclassified Arthrobacter]|uniref:permease n=1 Tax=unclassified Arthrobacter TaxID=235627 RepID=UPI001F3A4318|nr:permease [Arthrobacter sp. FW306-07-I]UKA75094.1 permease [Arthrobacter sp. FW306-07-I]
MKDSAAGIDRQDNGTRDTGQRDQELTPDSAARRMVLVGTLATAGIAIAVLLWAKWYPYALKIPAVADSHSLGNSVLSGKASAPPAPSWNAAFEYSLGYVGSIWQALVAGLLVAAAVEAFLPARRLLALFQARRGPAVSTVCGGLLSMSSMMCTCCAAPVALNVRRRGVPVSSALAYWLGNPVLNPAALAFMAFVLPWQFVAVRVGTGVILVFGVTLLVSRLAKGTSVAGPVEEPAETVTAAGAVHRFAKALVRLSVRLLPEYAVVVMLLGAFRGWLFPEAGTLASWGVLAAVLLAVVGTLFVIPTAAEIPIIGALMAAGVGMVPLAALVLTLPALSLPSMLMVRGAFPGRVIAATGAAVMGLGLAGAVAMAALT